MFFQWCTPSTDFSDIEKLLLISFHSMISVFVAPGPGEYVELVQDNLSNDNINLCYSK